MGRRAENAGQRHREHRAQRRAGGRQPRAPGHAPHPVNGSGPRRARTPRQPAQMDWPAVRAWMVTWLAVPLADGLGCAVAVAVASGVADGVAALADGSARREPDDVMAGGGEPNSVLLA